MNPPLILSEFGGATSVGAQFRRRLKDTGDLSDAISSRLRREYEKSSKSVLKDLYSGSGKQPPSFSTTAKWKQKQLDDYAKRVSKSMAKTVDKQRDVLARRYPDNPNKQKAELDFWLRDKQADLEQAIAAEAKLQAQADQLVHSGAVDPNTARIMYFVGPQDSKTCPYCNAVIAGNPWTIKQATDYGARLHPHCRHEWENRWEVDKAELAVLKRRIRDGEIKGWGGGSQTPAKGPAQDAAKTLQQHRAGWPLQKRAAVRALRRAGVPEDDVNAMLTRTERNRRISYLRRRATR